MKTRDEVEALKNDWLADPHYDLSSEDILAEFSEYKDELIMFEKDTQAEWDRQADEKLRKLMSRAGIENKITGKFFQRLICRIEALEEEIQKLKEGN